MDERNVILKRAKMLCPEAKEFMLMDLIWKADLAKVRESILVAIVKDGEKDILAFIDELRNDGL